MARDPEKTEEIRIYCRPEIKEKWAAGAVHYEDNEEFLRELLRIFEENPNLVRT